jgi:hypothetical protein
MIHKFKVTVSRPIVRERDPVGLPLDQKEYRRAMLTVRADDEDEAREKAKERAEKVFSGWPNVTLYPL